MDRRGVLVRFSGSHRFGCDSVATYQAVLTPGKVVATSTSKNRDL